MKTRFTTSRTDAQDGQILVLFALMSIVLIGFLALAIDTGYLMTQRRTAQAAADSASLAGAASLMAGKSDTEVKNAAKDYAVINGIAAPDDVNATVEGDSQDGKVTVDVQLDVTKFFIGALYTGDWKVSAHSVSEVTDASGGDYALVALQPPGIYINGDVNITIKDGGAMSNSDVTRKGGHNAFVVDGSIDAVGSVDPNGNWVAPGGFNGKRGVLVDPLAGAVPPKPGALMERTFPSCDDCTLLPGLYQNEDLTISGTATLQPGTYYFKNASIDLKNKGTIKGTGVMLYFAGNSVFFPKNGAVDLTAPPTSPYADGPDRVAVWISNCTDFDTQGNGTFYIGGILYAPCSNTWLHGNPAGNSYEGQIIVGSFDTRGTTDIGIQYYNYVATKVLGVFLTE